MKMSATGSNLKRERKGPVKIADCYGEWKASDGAMIMVRGDSVQRQAPGNHSSYACTAPLKEITGPSGGTVQWDSWQISSKSPEKIIWKHMKSKQEVWWKKIDSAKQSAYVFYIFRLFQNLRFLWSKIKMLQFASL